MRFLPRQRAKLGSRRMRRKFIWFPTKYRQLNKHYAFTWVWLETVELQEEMVGFGDFRRWRGMLIS